MRERARLLSEVHLLRDYVEELCDQLGEEHPSVQDYREVQAQRAAALPPIIDRPGQHHRGAGKTEVDAANLVMPKVGTDLHTVLVFFYDAEDDGCTDWELRRLLDKPDPRNSSAQARRTDLSRDGWVEWSGRTRPGELGPEVNIWVMSPVGRTAFEKGMGL